MCYDDKILAPLFEDYKKDLFVNTIDITQLPSRDEIELLIDYLEILIFPKFSKDKTIEEIISLSVHLLKKVLAKACKCADVDKKIEKFLLSLPSVRKKVEQDIEAFFENDPACISKEEVVLSYPGFKAILVYRLSHELYLISLPLIPRMMSEFIHSLTGIDIHPGCDIGKRFFIDHGTGVVIGETCKIGDNVKIYQGVTLGALSTKGGQKLKGKKRHPTICDNVTIYSGATVLGGETVIGKDTIVGGNAFITSSLEPGSKVF